MTELLVDVHGLRTFRVSDDGNLLPITAVDDSWRNGVCIARCRRRANHEAPVEKCRCGIYTFRSVSVLRSQYEPADSLIAVVALEGQTLAGSRGWRSQAGRVVALWIKPGALPDGLVAALARNLPGVPFFSDVNLMLRNWPDLLGTNPDDGAYPPLSWTPNAPKPMRRPGLKDVRVGRVPIYIFVTIALTWLFVYAEQWSQRRGGHNGAVGSLDIWAGFESAMSGVGLFIAANLEFFAWPLLMAGLFVWATRLPAIAGEFASVLLRVLIPVTIAAGVAAIVTSSPIEFSPIAGLYCALILWREMSFFLFSVSKSDGTTGQLARRVLCGSMAAGRAVLPNRRDPGVRFRPQLDNHLSGYPLVVPVGFAPNPAAGRGF